MYMKLENVCERSGLCVDGLRPVKERTVCPD
jgi:hypothetical protein